MLVYTSANAPSAAYGTPAPFNNFVVFSPNFGNGAAPVGPSGNMFVSDGSFTTGSFADLHNVTFSNWYLNFANMAVNGSGHAVFGGGSGTIGTAPTVLTARVASGGNAQLLASTNAASASSADGFEAIDSSGNNVLFAGVNEAANTGTTFGISNNEVAKLVTAGTANLGLLIGNTTNVGIVIGTNNLERARFNAGGGMSLGTTTDSGTGNLLVSGTIRSNTGFNINGAAGLTQTCTVNQAKTLIFTLGILTGGTCNT
jgi:hypothetical protein